MAEPEPDFPQLRNDRLLRAARGEPVDRAPVWLVRQGARYLPEFVELRKKYDFFKLCKTPELASEATLQPVLRFPDTLDAAIMFGDILVVPQALGMALDITLGPHFPHPLRTPADLEKLHLDADLTHELKFMLDGLSHARRALDGAVPLIGFAGAPWTLLVFMTGGGSKTQVEARRWLREYPEESAAFMLRLADHLATFLVAQVRAGAQYLQVFESFAGEFPPEDLERFSLPALRKITEGVRAGLAAAGLPAVPLSLYAKGASSSLSALAALGFDVISVDPSLDLADARAAVAGHEVALHGNADDRVLFKGREAIEEEVKRVCERARESGGTKRWVASLGHGVPDGATVEAVGWMLECFSKYSAAAGEGEAA